MDRFFRWEMSQMRRRDLLETAGVVRRRPGLRETMRPAGSGPAELRPVARRLLRLVEARRPPGGGRRGEVIGFPAAIPFQAGDRNPSATLGDSQRLH